MTASRQKQENYWGYRKVSIAFCPIYLETNQGHGNARRVSLANCHNELVALMDADDISLPDRFRQQLAVFKKDKLVHIVGGQISEFIDTPNNIVDRRVVPTIDKEIKQYMKKRCPMNQVSVMFKKNFVESVGGYIDWFCEEDYYLWIRMAQAAGVFANVDETLVNVRIGDEMSARRGGWKYFSSEAKLQKYMLNQGIISIPQFLYNVAIRFGGEVVVPNKIRTKLFKMMREESRNSVDSEKEDQETLSNQQAAKEEYPPFSVAMCVYGGDNADWFDTALDSVVNQTVPPDEIVLVVDGPIPCTIQNVIDKYTSICAGGVILKVIYLEKNFGHGIARRTSLENTRNDIVALMDADDICVLNRFEQEIKVLCNTGSDIVGGNISEFIGTVENVVGNRIVPCDDTAIKAYMKKRCPFNQMTVMFRKECYDKAGGYLDWYCDEDYYLWIRMMLSGAKFSNTGTILVYARAGEEMYQRRGGIKYFKSEAKLQGFMLNNKLISLPRYTINVAERLILQVLMPNKIRGFLFQKLARKQ